jgi:hypothetical protein
MQLTLVEDEKQHVYVWISKDDQSKIISPHFDYREDAMQWYEQHSHEWDHYSGLPSPQAYE